MATPNKPQTPIGGPRRPTRDGSTEQRSMTTLSSARNATPSSTPKLNRSRSSNTGSSTPISAKAAVKRPINGSPAATNGRTVSDADAADIHDEKLESAAVIDELQERLQIAEKLADDLQRQVALLQSRIHDSLAEQTRLEETVQELTDKAADLENDKRESLRTRRDLDTHYESEKKAAEQVKEEAAARERELQHTVQRLKDTLAQRGFQSEGSPSASLRSNSFRGGHPSTTDNPTFAPPTPRHSDIAADQQNDPLILKDKIIEGLRLELADVQIKMLAMESMGSTQTQQLEQSLLEQRMANARLVEENDSFQLLLSSKTLSGDLLNSAIFHRADVDADATPTSDKKRDTLADELDAADTDDEGTKQFKVQIAALKDENKALSSYINNIISRLLAHEMEFVLDKDPTTNAVRSSSRSAEKELPPPPPVEREESNEGFLARTRSMMGGRKPRPQSMLISEPPIPPTPHENSETAPSIPIGRGQPRSTSGGQRRGNPEWNSAAVVNSMYRGPSPTRSSGQLSPHIASPRNSFFGPRPSITGRTMSGASVPAIDENEPSPHKANRDSKLSSSGNSVISDASQSASPPQSNFGGVDRTAASVMVGSKMRPLRLVQNADDEMAAKKAANRQSWMGWFNQK